MEQQPFKLEERKYFGTPEHPAHSPSCPFCGTGYVSAILAIELDGDEYRQRFKCDKHFCGTEFDVVFRGNSNRRFFHGPGIDNWDFSLHKSTAITEKTNLEFRAEFFNVFNHAQFSGVTGDILGSFGAVTSARAPRIGQLALKLSF